ncbi:MAG TPA: C13 family peptidase [Xanthobacteraceae bacterium]|nr:C13 family peptidase [Xanthobacteraceae bacterium]
MWGILKFAARAAVWRRTPNPPLVGLPVLLGFAVLAIAVRVALQFLTAESWHTFNPYGLNSVLAWTALELAAAAFFVHPAVRASALSALLVLAIVVDIVATAIKWGLPQLAINDPTGHASTIITVAIFAVAIIWGLGALARIVQSLEAGPRWRLIGRVVALGLALLIADAALPQAPVFLPPHFDSRNANWWEALRALHDGNSAEKQLPPELARLEQAQPKMLQSALAELRPQQPGITDVYALGIAGWGEQDVFRKELDGGLTAIASVLPIKGHTVRLINNLQTADAVPLADIRNFKTAVHAIAQVMDKNEDVLVLLMTSHGEQTGFALELPGGVAELTPQLVTSTLDSEGIKNRVVIVSACYAGIFLPPLRNDDSIVITAADATHTSFGCTPESEWTYFGDAFFRQSLHPGSDFEIAFNHARVLIQGWEMMDRLQSSNPQAHFGPAVVAKLAPYFATKSDR